MDIAAKLDEVPRRLEEVPKPIWIALMILGFIAYWPIGFACAWIFAFPLGFGGEGVWFGFVLGLAAAAVFLCGRFWLLVRRQKTAR